LTKTSFQTILNFDDKNKVYLTKKHFLKLHKREFLLTHDIDEFSIIANEFLRNFYYVKKNLFAIDSLSNDIRKILILLQKDVIKQLIKYIDILKLNTLNLFDFVLQDKVDEKEKIAKLLYDLEEDEQYYSYIWGD